MDARRYHQRYPQPYGWPRVDAWDLVVKVKYGDTLKRFNASVNGSHFDHDLLALRLKIATAFKFSPDTEFILTYTDEDGDDVMLDDDNDLRDAVVNQKLNPLRIIVQLKGSNVGAAQTKQHTTDLKSPRSTSLEDQLAQVKSAIDEALKFVPEQIPAVFAKLSHDLRSRAALSAPSLAELLDRFAKLIARSSNMQPSAGSGVGSQKLGNSEAKLESAPMTVSASEPSDMQNSGTPENGLKSVLLENPTAKIDQVSLCPSVEDSLVFTSLGGMKSELKRSADNEIKIKTDARSKGKSVISSVPPASTTSHGAPTQRPVPVPSMLENKLIYGTNPTYTSCGSNGTANGGLRSLFPPPPAVFHPRSPVSPPYNPIFGTNGKTSGGMLSTFSPPPNIYGPFEYPPSSVGTCFPNLYPIGSSHDHMASLHRNVPNPEEKSFGSSYRGLGANYGSIPQREQHRWVQCDGCGVTPIVGPRYKSNVKEDYDLCGACFSHIGNEAEYTRMDSPASRCNIKILERVPAAKTNSLFIKDVTVPDGTPMAPSHPFTKIWRVRNNGSTRWPYGTQLVWVGGDHLASPCSVRLAISVNGRINPCEETDVTVDFLAPARPGRYISYWRLALPSGQRFGQQIWVHIKVEQPIQSSGRKQAAAMSLNQLPEANSTKLKPFTIDLETNSVSSEPFYGCPGIPEANSTKLKPFILDLETNSVSSEPLRCPLSFRETMKLEESRPAPGDMSSVPTIVEPVQNPVTDVSAKSLLASIPDVVPASEAFPQPNPVPMLPVSSSAPVPAAPLPEQIINHLEEKLMTELEGLGFMQADLNKKILRQNNYDLEQSVAHLCGYDEWDALELSELR
ncbi:protein JOKA2-like isoform X3 [Miscanthus floridulus]|uniref:protein JOKA2-like isoform X3 n=1 Tax=Miscanthus floridulus TaxID=154761 RepID=UPI00345AEB59